MINQVDRKSFTGTNSPLPHPPGVVFIRADVMNSTANRMLEYEMRGLYGDLVILDLTDGLYQDYLHDRLVLQSVIDAIMQV